MQSKEKPILTVNYQKRGIFYCRLIEARRVLTGTFYLPICETFYSDFNKNLILLELEEPFEN